MALIKCYECEKEISDKAPACPHCGAPTGEQPPQVEEVEILESVAVEKEPAPSTQKTVSAPPIEPEPVARKDERFNHLVAFAVGAFLFQIVRSLGLSFGPLTVVFLLVPWALLVRYGKKQSPQAYAGIIAALVVVFGIANSVGPGDVFIPRSVETGSTEESGVPMDSPLLDPAGAAMNQPSPDVFRARFETTAGDFVIEVNKEWAPTGADRFYNLVNNGFYDGVAFFRVIEGFMAQFGIHGNPVVSARWQTSQISDDAPTQSNTRGTVSFGMTSQPNSRTTQIFINFGDNSNLDSYGFVPFGTVAEGMDVVDQLYSGYGEGAPQGTGPDQMRFTAGGNAYLESEFPQLDYVERATIIGG